MNSSTLRLNPLRALPVAFALILNAIFGPLILVTMAPTAFGYVGSTAFELDGNIDHSGSGHDWDQVYADDQNGTNTSGADNVQFITDLVNTTADDIFTGGGAKDQQPIQGGPWLWTTSKPQPKDDITHAFAAAYTIGGHTIAYFGLDKYEVDGDNQVGFWFFKNGVAKTNISSQGGFKFSGDHAVGDILVLADYTNGGTVPNFSVFKWVGSGGSDGSLDKVADTGACTNANQFACGITNADAFTSNAWPYKNRDVAAQNWPAGALFEGGLDLTHFGLDTGCFSTFLAETRSSQSVTATLSDFALGNFSFCEQPNLETQVSSASVNVGDSVTDLATLSGNKGPVNGTVDFFVCGPTQAVQECTSGGDAAGAGVAVVNGQATSDPVLASAAGFYCFRSEFTPEAGSKYLATTHTATAHECFEAKSAVIHVTKVADDASVTAGTDIGFKVTVSNSGTGDAKGVTLTDALPGGSGAAPVHWTIDGSVGDPASFDISGADGAQQLTLDGQPIELAAGASLMVHVTAATTADNCGTYDNTADVATTNDGSGSASASTEVVCPDVSVEKSTSTPVVNAGEQVSYDITVSAGGTGDSTNVSLNDSMPAGITWSLSGPDASDCGIAAGTLTCNFGTMHAGDSKAITLTGIADTGDCPSITNSATVTSDVDVDTSNNSAGPVPITINCPSIHITKVADASEVSAGDPIGFLITVSNSGPGTAKDVTVSDTLPTDAGLSWSIDGGTGAGSCTIDAGVLTCSFGEMASGASLTVHISSPTTAETCGLVDNTASVTTSNDGSGEASDSVTVNCAAIAITKVADDETVFAGDTIGFMIKVTNNGEGAAHGVTLTDPLPSNGGLAWTIDQQPAGDPCAISTGVLSCSFGDLLAGTAVSIHITSSTTAESCGLVHNEASVTTTNDGTAHDSDDVTVKCPTLVIEKSGTPDVIDVSEGTTNHTVTWTLTYTLSDGPVTNAQIVDTIPAGLTYVDGSASVAPTSLNGQLLTWDFPLLSSSGVITFRTTVDDNIGGGVTLTNVVTIESDQTPQDSGQDNVKTIETAPPQEATPSVPNTALALGQNGQPIQIPVELMVLFFISSLSGLALANVRAVRRRRS